MQQGETVETEDEGVAAIQLESVEDVDFILMRMAELEKQQVENARIIGLSISRLQGRLEVLNKPLKDKAERYRQAVAYYAEGHRQALLGHGKKRSRDLPHGSVGWRQTPQRVRVVDEAAVLAWARTQPVESELVVFSEDISKAALSAHVKATGEVPPGVQVEAPVDEVVVKAVMAPMEGETHGD